MPRAAIYARISLDRGGEGLGVARQEADCRALCDRLGWDVAGLYVDNDVSAFSGKRRPEYRRLLNDLGNTIDAVVCWHPDRLHRSTVELEEFIEIIETTHVKVATVMAGEYDLETATGRMGARIVGAVARHESEQKAERTARKHLELAQAGNAHGGGHRPFGYAGWAGPLDDDEAALIREAARRIIAGDGLRTIVREWETRGVRTSTGRSKMTAQTLKRVLTSARVVGLREHHGVIVAEGQWPPILDRVTWDQVRLVLNDPARMGGGFHARVYLLTGLIRCGVCRGPMYAKPFGVKPPSYYCLRSSCTRIVVSRSEEWVRDKVIVALSTETFAAQLVDAPDDEDLVGQIAEVEREIAQWDLDKEMVGRARWLANTQRLEGRLRGLRKRLGAIQRRSVAAQFAGREMSVGEWDGLGFDRQRALLGELVERVVVARAVVGTNRFDHRRLKIKWVR